MAPHTEYLVLLERLLRLWTRSVACSRSPVTLDGLVFVQPRSQGFSPPKRGQAGKDPSIGRSRD